MQNPVQYFTLPPGPNLYQIMIIILGSDDLFCSNHLIREQNKKIQKITQKPQSVFTTYAYLYNFNCTSYEPVT